VQLRYSVDFVAMDEVEIVEDDDGFI